jgi:hypothetical protein
MPLPKRPYVASADQIRITRDGDVAVIEYADDAVATTRLAVGAERLTTMSDDELLEFWNESVRNNEEFRETVEYVAIEIPIGKPQVEYAASADQWTPRGNVLRCQVLSGSAPDEPFVSIDGRDFTLAEFAAMIQTCEGWGMRIEFVPDDELHIRPQLKVAEPEPEAR